MAASALLDACRLEPQNTAVSPKCVPPRVPLGQGWTCGPTCWMDRLKGQGHGRERGVMAGAWIGQMDRWIDGWALIRGGRSASPSFASNFWLWKVLVLLLCGCISPGVSVSPVA